MTISEENGPGSAVRKHFVVSCDVNGVISMGDVTPAGWFGLVLACDEGAASALRAAVEVNARHAYREGNLLVPGVPEAQTAEEAATAAEYFATLILRRAQGLTGFPERKAPTPYGVMKWREARAARDAAKTDKTHYRVFRRRWWRRDPSAPDGRSPDATARKTTICFVEGIAEARRMCADWNECHDPGFLGTKAEFEVVG